MFLERNGFFSFYSITDLLVSNDKYYFTVPYRGRNESVDKTTRKIELHL